MLIRECVRAYLLVEDGEIGKIFEKCLAAGKNLEDSSKTVPHKQSDPVQFNPSHEEDDLCE